MNIRSPKTRKVVAVSDLKKRTISHSESKI